MNPYDDHPDLPRPWDDDGDEEQRELTSNLSFLSSRTLPKTSVSVCRSTVFLPKALNVNCGLLAQKGCEEMNRNSMEQPQKAGDNIFCYNVKYAFIGLVSFYRNSSLLQEKRKLLSAQKIIYSLQVFTSFEVV